MAEESPSNKPAEKTDLSPTITSTSPDKTNVISDISRQHTANKPCGCGSMEGSSNPNGTKMMTPSYVYAIGRIQPRFPRPAVEKEFVQATGRAETAGLTDREALRSILSKRENRYLVRQMCWVLTIEGIETYIPTPRDPADFDLLVEALRPAPHPTDVDIVIGTRGPLASPELCNGLIVPLVIVDQIYSFDIDSLVKAVPRPEKIPAKQFTATVEDVFNRIMQMADNAGATDEHRALNYLAVRYQAIYSQTAEMFGRDFSLTAIEVRPSPLSGVRKIVDVIFSYTNRNTDFTEKYFIRVDVTEQFPFLVTKLSPYYDL
jgi:PatG C-terminal